MAEALELDGKPTRKRTGRILVVDDEPNIRIAFERLLGHDGHQVRTAQSAEEALKSFDDDTYDVVVSDIRLPSMDGLELLRGIRQRNPDVPVILITGGPSLESAMKAMTFGALRYLVKPVDPDELRDVICEAVSLNKMAAAKREALALMGRHDRLVGDRAALEVAFDQAMKGATLHFQPIVRWSDHTVMAYEALLRMDSSCSLPKPDAVIDAAERLGWVHRLSRRVRQFAATALPRCPEDTRLFVNLHAKDLNDPMLFDACDPLFAHSRDVVFEITERHSLADVEDVHVNVARLKQRGFRVALDDFGAGHAGLTSFAILEPDIIKLDMDLVRNIDRIQTKRKLVESMVSVCKDLGVEVVAEGVERVREFQTLQELGCDVFQGFLFGRPAALFAEPAWPAAER